MEWSQANLDSVEKGGHSLAGKQLAILNLQPANGGLDQVLQCVFRPQACVCTRTATWSENRSRVLVWRAGKARVDRALGGGTTLG